MKFMIVSLLTLNCLSANAADSMCSEKTKMLDDSPIIYSDSRFDTSRNTLSVTGTAAQTMYDSMPESSKKTDGMTRKQVGNVVCVESMSYVDRNDSWSSGPRCTVYLPKQ